MKKVVLRVDLHDDKAKQKAMKTVSTLSGIDSIAVDMKTCQLTVIGSVDPVNIVSKLRKHWPSTTIVLVGPAKEPEKKEDQKKEEPKKEEEKKEESKKEEPKKDEPKKDEAGEKKEGEKKEGEKKDTAPPPPPDPVMEMAKAYRAYNPHLTTYYHVQSIEENPNACVIC